MTALADAEGRCGCWCGCRKRVKAGPCCACRDAGHAIEDDENGFVPPRPGAFMPSREWRPGFEDEDAGGVA